MAGYGADHPGDSYDPYASDDEASRGGPTRDIVGERATTSAVTGQRRWDHAVSAIPRQVIRERVKILFIAADDRMNPHLALNEEFRLIQSRLRASDFRDAFEIVPELAVRLSDLQRALLQHRPDIVHFACHGNERAELVLLRDDGTPVPVAATTLVSYFRILHDNIALVVLNACFASTQAGEIRNTVGMAIGMRRRISDAAATRFSGAFYESLAYGRSVRQSFELGVTAIGPDEGDVPELFERGEGRADAVCFVGGPVPGLAGPRWRRGLYWLGAIAAVGMLAVFAARAWIIASNPTADPPLESAAPTVEPASSTPGPPGPPDPPDTPGTPGGAAAATADAAGMVRFSEVRIRPGVFDPTQRMQVCAAVPPEEDCARQEDPREITEIALSDFYLDRYEVTSGDFAAWLDGQRPAWRTNEHDPSVIETIETPGEPSVFLAHTGENCSLVVVAGHVRSDPTKVNQPATCMTWRAAHDYCLAHRDHKRLPLDSEWEFAAKGRELRVYPWGATAPRVEGIAYGRGGSDRAHPVDVGTSIQDVTPQGVHDLGGNVAEWVDRQVIPGQRPWIRGGSWNSGQASRLLVSSCKRIDAESFAADVGFRCAKTP